MVKLKRTELESSSKEESVYRIPTKRAGHINVRKVKENEDNCGLYRKRDAHSARLQECDENIDVSKQLKVEHVKKLGAISKLERSTADQPLQDEKTVAYGQYFNYNESSSKEYEVILETERLKEAVEKWKDRYRCLEQTISSIKKELRSVR